MRISARLPQFLFIQSGFEIRVGQDKKVEGLRLMLMLLGIKSGKFGGWVEA